MKVNGNDLTLNLDVQKDGGFLVSSIPIRLEIASRILAVNLDWYIDHIERRIGRTSAEDMANAAIETADALIKAHNETCGGE